MLQILQDGKLTTRQGQIRVQDAYSLRCLPQIHGASRLAFDYVRSVIETEINSVTDNPLIFPDNGDIFSGGNFHGQPVAIAMDTLGIAMAEFALSLIHILSPAPGGFRIRLRPCRRYSFRLYTIIFP